MAVRFYKAHLQKNGTKQTLKMLFLTIVAMKLNL